jgi:hypothetical protein
VQLIKSCSHSNFGEVFGKDRINCDIDLRESYVNISKELTDQYARSTKALLERRQIDLKYNPGNDTDPGKLAVYDFTLQNLDCLMYVAYYNDQTSGDDRAGGAPVTGNAGFIEIDCSGGSKRDYFPKVVD